MTMSCQMKMTMFCQMTVLSEMSMSCQMKTTMSCQMTMLCQMSILCKMTTEPILENLFLACRLDDAWLFLMYSAILKTQLGTPPSM